MRDGDISVPRTCFKPAMDLLHHQAMLREEEEGLFICSRCGLVNPPDDEPCIPLNLEPAQPGEQAA